MNGIIKTYGSYSSGKRHGIRCEINVPSGSYPLHRHDYFEVEIIRKGCILHELNGVRDKLSRAEVVALSPKDLHRFTVLDDVEIYSLCIYYKDAPSSIQKMLGLAKFPFRATVPEEKFENILDCFLKTEDKINTGGAYDREIISAYTTLLLAGIFEFANPVYDEKSAGGYMHIARAMEYISESFTSPITLCEVADFVHLTPSYFSKLFSEINGKGFSQYVTEQRIEHAKKLLETTELGVTDIAFSSGFSSFSSFSRSFRQECGCTPSEFRKYTRTT